MPTNDVAVFVDFENIYISIRNKYGEQPNFDSIRDKCEEYGRVTIARAYADWYRYPRVTNALYANSIEPMYVPTYYYDREEGRIGRAIKNSVDIHMCIDCMKTLYTHPNIDTYVIITGDRDFIPLINAIRQQGKRAIVIGVADAASSHLAQSADEFIFYSNVLGRYDEEEDEEDGRRPGKREKDPYGVLVQAVKLARQRGNLATLATLKLLMVELMGDFDETKLKDKKGRPFSKFRDFVREAEQRNLVQVFSSGSVTEVFLPGEDPLKLSQFAPESLDDEIEVIRPRQPETSPAPAAESAGKSRSRRSSRKGKAGQPQLPSDGAPVEPEVIVAETLPIEEPESPAEPEIIEPELEGADGLAEDIGDEEWQIFNEMMQQFDQPVLFIEIFDSLRALRNKEVLDLSNKQMKEMIKESINRKILVRSTRGNHAYYRLNPDLQPDVDTDGEPEVEPAE
ncbi:MAG: NYN domain-containing protein [Anaerolineae bacterium]